MNVIDALVITLSLDSASYTTGSKKAREDLRQNRKAAEETAKSFEEGARKSVAAFDVLRKEIIGLLAVFTGGVALKQFVEQTVNTDAAVGRLAKNLDISTEELSAWQGVLKRSGGTAEDASAGLQTLVGAFEQIQLTGQSPLIPYLNLLGIKLQDLKNPTGTLLKLADAFSKMDPKQAAAIGQGMGLSPAMISLLERGRGAVQGMLEEQRKIGVVTAADAAAAIKLQNTLSSLKQAFTSIGRDILTILAPALDTAAKAMAWVGELAQRNKPIVTALFLAVAGAAAAAMLPVAALALDALALVAPFLLAGAAIGALVEVVMTAGRWLMNLLRSNQQTRAAMGELSAAARELMDALRDAFAPLKPVFDAIWSVVKSIGGAIQQAFGPAALAVAKTFINFLVNQFHALADVIHAVTALMHGDLNGAMAAAKDFARDELTDPRSGVARRSAASPAGKAPAAGAGGGVAAAAASMIAGFEGFLGHAKWDRNAFRLGFGSDTITDPRTGKITRVAPGATVDKASATADLARRVQTEFMPKVAAAVGSGWAQLSTAAKTALTSVAYNYGHLPTNVLRAARSGDAQAIAQAIKDRAGDNAGLNANRRRAEAAAVLGGDAANSNAPALRSAVPVGARAQVAASGAVSTSSSTSVEIGSINIQTQARDAAGIARDIGPAIRQRSHVTQANYGLG